MQFSINARPTRKFLDAATEQFFRSIIDPAPFAVYGCLTFAEKVGETLADKHFRDLVQYTLKGSHLKDNIGWLRATERALSGCSDSGTPLHFHFIAISHGFLSPGSMARYWSDAVGNCKIEKYDPSRKGIGYILKFRDHDRCDWAFSDNFYLFRPGYQPSNKDQRRAFKRQALRDAKRSLSLKMLALPVAGPIAPVEALACSSKKVSDTVTTTMDYQIHPDAIFHALDAEIDLLRKTRALLTGEATPLKLGRPLETGSIATKKSGLALRPSKQRDADLDAD